jgi:hypothetical protein
VGLKLAWPLLGFVGFQKSKKLLATAGGLFLSSGIHKRMPLELTMVIFLTLLKGKWFMDCLLFHKLLLLDRCPVSVSLVGFSHWLTIDGYGALVSDPRARKHMCSYLSLVHFLFSRFVIHLLMSGVCSKTIHGLSEDHATQEVCATPDKRMILSFLLSNLGDQVFSWSLQPPHNIRSTSRL